MGCAVGKRKSAYNRLSQYQIASFEESKGLKQPPNALDCEDEEQDGVISVRQFHNLFYDGFYAPYIRNPDYLLLVDVRDETQFNRQHVVTSRWHGRIDWDDLSRYFIILLYDQDGKIDQIDSPIQEIFQKLKDRKVEPVCIREGFRELAARYPYMITKGSVGGCPSTISISWYPSIILDKKLYLGRADQATNPSIVSSLGITHVLCVSEGIPPGVFPSLSYLVVPFVEGKQDGLLSKHMPAISSFITEAFKNNGRVLVHGDQGINRSAIVVMAFLMQDRVCPLDDAYYYVRSLRPVVQPSDILMEQLSKMEEEIFGKKITYLEDLIY